MAIASTTPVYTVCDESRYLIVKNVPALGCIDELVKLFGLYGPIEEYRLMDEEECEPFTDVYWIKFMKISNARFAKRKLDGYNFLGNLLQVAYTPIYETLWDTKDKLEERRAVVLSKIKSEKQKTLKQAPWQLAGVNDPTQEEMSKFPKFSQSNTAPSEDSGQHMLTSYQYFPSASMNATVQAVRQKLDQISSSGKVLESLSSKSTKQHETPHSVEGKPAEKKLRLDNRRRI